MRALRAVVVAFVLVLVLPAAGASAQLVDRGYSLDVIDLPVLGSSRALGLGGAYASAGEGISAQAWNPAGIGRRTPWENDWFEWDISLGGIFGGLLRRGSNADHYFGSVPGSSVTVAVDKFFYFDLGLRLQFGPGSFSMLFRPRHFEIGNQSINASVGHVDFAWSLLEGQLIVAGGFRVLTLDISEEGIEGSLLDMSGVGVEAGATYAPVALPFRTALALRTPIEAKPEVGAEAMLAYTRPETVVLPWEVILSGTYGFGPRPLNARTWHEPRRRVRLRREAAERRALYAVLDEAADTVHEPADDDATIAADMDPDPSPEPIYVDPPRQRYGFVTMDLVIQGRVDNGIGLDGFLTQTVRPWGRRITASPRLGIEGEPWLNRMKLRGGAYLEARRPELANPRVHFTSGFDLRLFDTDVFGLFSKPFGVQISFASDVSARYFNFGLGVGFWH